jgi:hypothetical protein
VVCKRHQHASVDESMLLLKRRRYIELRFTPPLTDRDQLDAQETDEWCISKNPFDQRPIAICHLHTT